MYDVMTPMTTAFDGRVASPSSSLFVSSLVSMDNDSTTSNLVLSVIEEGSEVAARQQQQGLTINWDHPGESIGGIFFLLYVSFSVLAGIKYIVKDGWRPKF